MHKTFTDCYLAPGFAGGSWTYAMNSNETDGEVSLATELEGKEQRLAFYLLGWDSLQVSFSLSS
jgi:hypothetical protein